MRTIEMLDGGLFTTVQDLGRLQYQRYGVAVSGAMDSFALRAANRLVGNADSAAGLEVTLLGPEMRFAQPAQMAVTGANLGPSVDGRPIPMWRTVAVRAGSVLSFSGQRDGMRAYLAVDGGIDVPVVLGSRSTSTRSGLGGFEGRPLRAGDVLPVGEPPSLATLERGDPRHAVPGAAGFVPGRPGCSASEKATPLELAGRPLGSPGCSASEKTTPLELAGRPLGSPGSNPAFGNGPRGAPARRRARSRKAIPSYGHDHRVRVVFGPQDDAFSDEGRSTFLTAVYTMTSQSDRIGCRFDGPRIAHRTSADIVSDGTTLGIVQVSGDGMPIVLMADRGTTGGYTKIATVISADVWRLAQAGPGDRVRFEAVALDEALERLREQEAVLDALVGPEPDGSSAPDEDVYDEDAGSGLAAGGFGDLADALDETRRGRNR